MGDKARLAKAKEDMAENVSVAGWKEAFQEKLIWIRRIYQIALLILSGCCLYYCHQVIEKRLQIGYTDEIEEVADIESLPMTNVTICAQVYLNKTFVRESINIPKEIADNYIKVTGGSIDTLYEQLTLFLIQTMRPKNVDTTLLFIFSKILRQNLALNDFSAFTIAGLPKCEDMLKRCWFGRREFNCCDKAVRVLDNDGICYLLVVSTLILKAILVYRINFYFWLNFDSDNAESSNSTWSQAEPGPNGGLTVEALVNVKDSQWLDDVSGNGYRVYVSAAPFGDVVSPLGAPHGSKTFIKVTPTKHLLATNCAPHGRLSMGGEELMYYDPEGFTCLYTAIESLMYKYQSCLSPLPLYSPNSSVACTPMILYAATCVQTQTTQAGRDALLYVDNTDMSKIQATRNKAESDLRNAMSVKSKCPSHCSHWTYSSSASFVYLEGAVDDDRSDYKDTMFSKIHVYYGNLEYRQYNQVEEPMVYLAFYDFGNVVGFYWGMSIISFFHVFFYVPRYFYLLCKLRKKKARVAPVLETLRKSIITKIAARVDESCDSKRRQDTASIGTSLVTGVGKSQQTTRTVVKVGVGKFQQVSPKVGESGQIAVNVAKANVGESLQVPSVGKKGVAELRQIMTNVAKASVSKSQEANKEERRKCRTRTRHELQRF